MEKFTLWDHQKIAVERASKLNCFGLFFEMGTGKTLATITILRHKFAEHDRILKTLVLCPPIVIQNWRKEWQQFSRINPYFITPLVGTGKKRWQLLTKKGFHPDGRTREQIFITNYESLYMEDLLKAMIEWQPDVIVYDESHKCKDIKRKRTKRAITLADRAMYKYILTGTPILNSPMDLFSQYRILDGGEAFGKNFYAFRARYFYDKNAGMPSHRHFPNWVARESLMSELHERLESTSMTVKKSECLNLPPLVRQEIHVELGTQQKKAYVSMEKAYVAEMEEGVCTAALALTKGLRLQQIASGFVPVQTEEEGVVKEKIVRMSENPRALALKELLETLTTEHKVIVWAVFKDNYKAIADVCESLKIKYVSVTGEQKQKEKDKAVEDFNEDESVRVLVGHPGAGGIGINLVSASYSIFYSRGFSLEYDLQAEARNYRGGSEVHEKVTRIDLIATATIDEKITEALGKKMKISDRVLLDAIGELQNER